MQNISKLYSIFVVIKCNTLQDSHFFSSPFVETTGYSRNCMKKCNHDRPQFQTFGFTNICTVQYLSTIIHYRGSNSLTSPKPLVLATEIQYTLYVSLPTFRLHFTFPLCQNTEPSSDVTFCITCSISRSKFSHLFDAILLPCILCRDTMNY